MRTVCGVMLANGREAMVRRAIASWLNQTYDEQHRMLLIFDSAQTPSGPADAVGNPGAQSVGLGIVHVHRPHCDGWSIGALRNEANRRTNAEIIVHWDSDDWSHPERISEQVALLESSGKDAVGYREMLFWRRLSIPTDLGEAWCYTCRNPHYCLGTSLCYWREVWQRNPFSEKPVPGEDDTNWILKLQTIGLPTFLPAGVSYVGTLGNPFIPRMIASIHGANTCAHIDERAEEWQRVPQWDEHCRKVMQL